MAPAAPAAQPGARVATAQGSSATQSTSSARTVSSRRRRGFGVVTPTACTECRKKRAKCDGQRPCGRCKAHNDFECHYEVSVHQSKDDLRSELDSLREHQDSVELVMAALTRADISDKVLARLRVGQSVKSICEWINDTNTPGGDHSPVSMQHSHRETRHGFSSSLVTSPSGTGWGNLAATGHANESEQNNLWHLSSENCSTEPSVGGICLDHITGTTPRLPGLERVLWPLEVLGAEPASGTWTNITSDINLVHHLLALYFCWEYPLFAPFSKQLFLRDFHQGRHGYCSTLLANALFALGCRLSAHPMARAKPDEPNSSGDHFFEEARRLLDEELGHPSMTTVQSLGIMSVREISCGRDSDGMYYSCLSMRLAIELGLHQTGDEGDEDQTSVRSTTFWGAFSLDSVLSLATGSLPQYTYLSPRPSKPVIIADDEASLWVPYTDDGVPPQSAREQPSNVLSVYTCFCGLTEIIYDSLHVLHSPVKLVTAEALLTIYTQYLDWYDQIPEVLRLGHNSTPTVLFTHMCYHFSVLHLFRPFLDIRILGSEMSPGDICHQAADAIQGLLKSYSQLYTLHRTPSLVPALSLASAISHLDVGFSTTQHRSSSDTHTATDQHVSEAIRQDIFDLTEMSTCHHSARQALGLLGQHAKARRIDIGVDDGKDLLQHYERLSTPYTNSINLMARRVRGQDFLSRQ